MPYKVHSRLQGAALGIDGWSLSGDLHLVVLFGDPLAVAIPMLRLSAWKNATRSVNGCVVLGIYS